MQEYKLIRSKRRWHSASLQVTRVGELIVRAPLYMPKFVIDQFVKNHDKWIAKRLKVISKPQVPLIKYFSSQAELISFIESQVALHSQKLGLYPRLLKYKNVKTYWGSCSPSSVISFNLHLMYTPKEAVEYVVVHELCHLKWRGHGERFWELIKKTYPKTVAMRKLLRQTPHSSD